MNSTILVELMKGSLPNIPRYIGMYPMSTPIVYIRPEIDSIKETGRLDGCPSRALNGHKRRINDRPSLTSSEGTRRSG